VVTWLCCLKGHKDAEEEASSLAAWGDLDDDAARALAAGATPNNAVWAPAASRRASSRSTSACAERVGARYAAGMPPTRPDPQAEQRELAQLDRVSHLLDAAIRIPGTKIRVGLDPILGLIPGVGDWAGALGSGYILVRAAGLGAARPTLLRMAANIGVDLLVGTVPVLGDLFDVGWRANQRNLALLRAHLEAPEQRRRADRGFVVMLLVGLGVLLVASVGLSLWLLGALLQAIFGG
jgi:hypothetical protein